MYVNIYHELRQSTERSVGKHDMERIIGRHVIACIDFIKDKNGMKFGIESGNAKVMWANAILYNVVGGQEDDTAFEKTVREMVNRFFEICEGILSRKMGEINAQRMEDQLVFYSSLSSQSRRTIVEIRKWVTNYVESLRTLSQANSDLDTWYMYASVCMSDANRLGLFLDVELCK